MARPEQQLHRTIATYLSAVLTGRTFATTFPAGGGGRARGAQLKSAGLVAGCPDILIIDQGRALWVELKAAKGRVSEAQGVCHARLWDAGSPVVVARSIDDVRAALLTWGIPLRESRRAAA